MKKILFLFQRSYTTFDKLVDEMIAWSNDDSISIWLRWFSAEKQDYQ